MAVKKALKLKKTVKKSHQKRLKPFVFAVGRRKTAIARVRLYSGKGETLVNSKPIGEYFPGEASRAEYLKPLEVTNTLGKYYATIIARGSGKFAQLGAVVLGLSRALDKENHELFHPLLKKEKLLTRDPRARERRKPGQMGRARKKKQSPKR
jgi:small subunit ribosomal protein S9